MTYHIQVAFIVYNPDLDLFVMPIVHFLFARSGRIWKNITHKTLILDSFNTIESYTVFVMFYLHITILFICEVWEVCKTLCQATSIVRGLKEYASIWNAIDWLVIIFSYISLMLTIANENA